jgi:hypothetical protein
VVLADEIEIKLMEYDLQWKTDKREKTMSMERSNDDKPKACSSWLVNCYPAAILSADGNRAVSMKSKSNPKKEEMKLWKSRFCPRLLENQIFTNGCSDERAHVRTREIAKMSHSYSELSLPVLSIRFLSVG